jgi:hypothetical protein
MRRRRTAGSFGKIVGVGEGVNHCERALMKSMLGRWGSRVSC